MTEGADLQHSGGGGGRTAQQTPPASWSRASVVPTVKFCLVYAAPLLLCLVFAAFGNTELPARCVYVCLLMAVYWATEALPLAITALIPIAAFPLMGIEATKPVVGKYMSGVIMMFLGGLIVAVAVESSNLHKRIALGVVRVFGTNPKRLMMSFMVATAFLSMWISNAAATAMMIPIVEGVTNSLSRSSNPPGDSFNALLLLSVAYAANIGGMGVVTGTPPNLVALAKLKDSISFPQWVAICCPLMLVNLIACWAYLRLVVWVSDKFSSAKKTPSSNDKSGNPKDNERSQQMGMQPIVDDDAESPTKRPPNSSKHHQQEQEENKNDNEDKGEDIKDFLNRSYKELGPISYKEGVILTLFVFLICLWLFQSPKFFTGWADVVTGDSDAEIHAATPAILVVVLTFMIPSTANPLPGLKAGKPAEFLMTWDYVQKKVPWGIILLLGGGLALSHGVTASGLDTIIVDQVKSIQDSVSLTGLNFLVCFATSMVTEVVSNTATSNIVLPMLVSISQALCVNPTYLVMSAVVTCSNAFMLPVATAPNALVFGAMKGKLSTARMMAIGGPMNVISLVITICIMEVWRLKWLDPDLGFPKWAADRTVSAECNATIIGFNSTSIGFNSTIE